MQGTGFFGGERAAPIQARTQGNPPLWGEIAPAPFGAPTTRPVVHSMSALGHNAYPQASQLLAQDWEPGVGCCFHS